MRKPYHRYSVRATLRQPLYDQHVGKIAVQEYEVFATTAREAISKARRERREQEGRYTVPATFKAQRIED